MVKNFILLLFIAFLSSCISVEFTKPQPSWCENLSEFPKEMHGKFYTSDNDTIEIGSGYYKLISSKTKDSSEINDEVKIAEQLSDSLLFKSYNKAYFLNRKEQGNWRISMISINKNKSIKVFAALESEDKLLKKIKRVKDKTILKDVNGKTTNIILNPTEKEFKKLISSKLFVEYMVLKRVD